MFTLKQLAVTKGPYVPTLNVMVPYLDFVTNQEYLVKRLKGRSGGQYIAPGKCRYPHSVFLISPQKYRVKLFNDLNTDDLNTMADLNSFLSSLEIV